jgi:hypothetical protein
VREEWDIPRLDAWYSYESANPPTHKMLAAFLGVEPKPRLKFSETESPDLLAMLSGMPGAAPKG